MWRHHRQQTSFLSLFGDFFLKNRNLRQNIPFSENCVAVWRFFAKSKITAPLFAHRLATAPQLQTQAD
jgi:hypothetical protein